MSKLPNKQAFKKPIRDAPASREPPKTAPRPKIQESFPSKKEYEEVGSAIKRYDSGLKTLQRTLCDDMLRLRKETD